MSISLTSVLRWYIYQPYVLRGYMHQPFFVGTYSSLTCTTWLHVSVLHNNYTGVRAEVLENTTVVARRCVFAECSSSTEQHTTRPLLWQTSAELKKQRAELCAHTTVALRSEWARWLHSEDQYTTHARIWWDITAHRGVRVHADILSTQTHAIRGPNMLR